MKHHKIILMEYKGKLEGVGLTTTSHLDDSTRKTIVLGGDPIIPISKIKEYSLDALTYSTIAEEIQDKFVHKPIKEARKYCKNKKISYCTITD